jgi:hypothetical protein
MLMPRALWALVGGRPVIDVELRSPEGLTATRTLLADTGAGTLRSGFELILTEKDCRTYGDRPSQSISLRGAYEGSYKVYVIHLSIPEIRLARHFRAVGVDAAPPGLDGIACYRFLSNFTFGNFGLREQFGVETR